MTVVLFGDQWTSSSKCRLTGISMTKGRRDDGALFGS